MIIQMQGYEQEINLLFWFFYLIFQHKLKICSLLRFSYYQEKYERA